MKIKKISIILSSVALLTLSSCYDLDRYPSDKLSSGTFWKTQAHADQAMMGVYSVLQTYGAFGIYFGLDDIAGIGMGYNFSSYQELAMGTSDAKLNYYNDKWNSLYEGIARANTVIQNIPNVNMDDELKAQYIAEAKFMRALYYSELINFYGDVPYYDETTVIERDFNNMLKPRTPIDEVRKNIINDLDEAINKLPETWDASNQGRATKDAAISLKGKILLYAKNYKDAATEFDKVIKSERHELYPNYANLFKPDGDCSSEMIFAVQNLGGVGQDYGMPMCWFMGSRSSFGSCWNNVMVSNKLVDSYELKDGNKFNWDDVFPGYNEDLSVREKVFRATLSSDNSRVVKYPEELDKLMAMYDNRDPRMQATVILPYTWYKGWVNNAPKDCQFVLGPVGGANERNGMIRLNANYENYPFRKFVPEYDMNKLINNRSHTPINFPIIRYADVLLLMAECQNELGKQDKAIELINKVRDRVNMPGINSGAAWLEAHSKEEVFERIRHERFIEFAGEGVTYNDLRRWKLLGTMNNVPEMSITGKTTYYKHVVNDRDYLWPIPGSEVEKNKEILIQNPGWEK